MRSRMFQADCEPNWHAVANSQYNLKSARCLGGLNRVWILQRVREAQHVVALAASTTAIRPDKQHTRACLQETGRAGRAYFHCAARSTLRDAAAAQERHDEKRADDQGDQNRAGFQIKEQVHGRFGETILIAKLAPSIGPLVYPFVPEVPAAIAGESDLTLQ